MLDKGNDPNHWWTALWGIVGIVLTYASVLGLQAMYYKVEDAEIYRKQVAPPSEQLEQIRAEQAAEISAYGWVDKDGGIARMPIDAAMDRVVAEIQAEGANQ